MEDKIAQALGSDDDHWVSPTTQVFAFVGLLYLSLKILSFWRMIVSLLILPGTPLAKFGGKGSWVLITGASDGIGKEYAVQLASKGFNVALVSRTQSKLLELAKEIKEKHGVETRNLAMDFAQNRDKDYIALKRLVDEIGDISILVNNVGLSHSMPVSFTETPEQEMKDIITINCMGTLRVTQMIAPGMQKRRRGLILTMASFGGIMPTPLLATYSGSKAFLQQWSSALHAELQPYGVHVQLIQSYLVTSAMSKIKRSSMLIPTPKDFVRVTLNKINRSGGAQDIVGTSTPYWTHGIMHWAISTFVGTMNPLVVGVNKRMHEDIRKRALKKQEREAAKSK